MVSTIATSNTTEDKFNAWLHEQNGRSSSLEEEVHESNCTKPLYVHRVSNKRIEVMLTKPISAASVLIPNINVKL